MKISVNQLDIIMSSPTIYQANQLEQKSKGSYFRAVKEILLVITDLSLESILDLDITEAIFILVSYRVLTNNNVPIYTSEDKKENILPIELVNSDYKKDEDERYFIIGGGTFTNSIYLADAILAEDTAKKENDLENFGLMLLACSHEYGFQEGWNIFKTKEVSRSIKGGLDAILDEFEHNKLVRIDFSSMPIKLSTNPDKNNIIKAFPFRSSRLFDIW